LGRAVPEHLALDDQRRVADHRLIPHRATPAKSTPQTGSLAVPAGTRTLSIFSICAIFNSPLRLSTAFNPNVVATANQRADNHRQRPCKAWGPDQSDAMRSGPDQRSRFNANRPFKQQPPSPQNNQTFDSNGPSIKIRGSAYQIFERYLTLAREATATGDRIAAENFYQHAEHYFRINNARREGNQQGTTPRPTTSADVEMNSSEANSREVDVDSVQPQWDSDDSVSSESSTH
jgi:hypothetical protein